MSAKARSRNWVIPTLIAATFLVLAACDSSETEPPAAGGTPPPGFQNLIVTIDSPVVNREYLRSDPLLVYTVTEGQNNDPVPVNRLSANVYDVVNNEIVVGSGRAVTNLASGSPLPTVSDGVHKLEFEVRDDSGQPILDKHRSHP